MHNSRILRIIVLSLLMSMLLYHCSTTDKKNNAPSDAQQTRPAEDNLNETLQPVQLPAQVQPENTEDTEKEIPSAEYPVLISVKELFIIGLSVPFEIIFFDSDKNIDKNFQLKSDLIFKVHGSPFIISSLNHNHRGVEIVEFPYEEADYKEGIFRGKISLDRLITGSSLKVYLKTDKNDLQLIGKTEIKFMVHDISDIGGILFSSESPDVNDVKAGQEFILNIYPFDNHGKPVMNINKALAFNISGQSAISINDIETAEQYQLTPALFSKGTAKIRIKAYKQGSYRISFTNGRSFHDIGIDGTWNSVFFNIIPSEPVRAGYTMPDNIIAGTAFNIIRILYDAYGNSTESGKFDITVIPFPENSITINDKPVKDDTVNINDRLDKIIISKSGIYSILLPDIQNAINKNLTVEPDIIICEIDRRNIIKKNDDTCVIIPFYFHDKYGNAPSGNTKFEIKTAYSSKGSCAFNGDGMRTEAKTINAGKYKITNILIDTDKNNASLIINTRETDFLKITAPGNEEISLKLALPVRIARDNKKSRIEFDYTDTGKTFEFTVNNLSVLLKKYTGSELFVTWQEAGDGIIIQYEFTYYRELNRLDYQEWDLTNKKRLLRILWRDIPEAEIHKAASSGNGEMPGNNEIFK